MMKLFSPQLLSLFLLLSPQLAAQVSSSAAAPAAESHYGKKLHLAGIHNAGKISDALYRGAQPKAEGLAELKELGVTTIVDLRGEDREKTEWERKRAESLGMHFVHIPVNGWSPPTTEQVAEFLSLFRGEPQQRIFVHCRFGDDRTGVFVATYRMVIQKWPADRALNEMYYFGFNGFWHPSMKSFIRDFPSRVKSSQALTSLQESGSQQP